jgi:Ca2+-binding EF-hand superfamily protein
MFNVELVVNDSPVQLSLSGKHLEPFLDRTGGCPNKLSLAKLQKGGYYDDCVKSGDCGVKPPPGTVLNNRSSVKMAYHTFVQQFRHAVNKRSGALNSTPKDVLLEMDENGNGTIDKKELLLGAHTLGISLTPNELEMIWPMFKPFDAHGNVIIDQFITTVMMNTKGKENIGTILAMEGQMLSLQKMNRHDRIRRKSALASQLATTSVGLRASLTMKLQEKSLTSDEAFVLLDTGNDNTIDKSEFYKGLERLGIVITGADLDAIWPMFNLDQDGTITKVEWKKFIDDKVGWSYKLMADRFSAIASSDTGGVVATTEIQIQPIQVSRRASNPSAGNPDPECMPRIGVQSRRRQRRSSNPDLATVFSGSIKVGGAVGTRSRRRFSNPDMRFPDMSLSSSSSTRALKSLSLDL